MIRRVFFAVGLDDDTRHALAAHLDAHLDEPLPGSVTPPENWHITLRFIGKASDVQSDRMLAFLDQHMATEPFSVRFGGLGAFPRPAKATVAWLAAEADGLHSLAASVEEAATTAGFMPEERPFHPHLTLSRVRPPRDLSTVVEGFPRFPRSMAVTNVGLYESTLRGRDHAVYTEIDRVEL
jgi:2'-5' RNA ligase